MALSGAARAAYLESLGRHDPQMRAEVESLLAAEQEAGSRFLETPAPAALDDAALRMTPRPVCSSGNGWGSTCCSRRSARAAWAGSIARSALTMSTSRR